MTEPNSESIQSALPSLAGEIWLAVKADFSELKQGFVEGSRQAVAEANGEVAKLPSAMGDAGTKGGTAFAKGVADKLPAVTDAATKEADKLPSALGQAGDKSGTAFTDKFAAKLPDVAADTSKALERAGDEGGKRGGERGGRAFSETINPMIRSGMREGTDAIADALGVWPELLDPFREALDHVFESLAEKLPEAAATGAASMSTELTTATAAAGATMDAELVTAGTAGGTGFGAAFSAALPSAMSGAGAAAGASFLGSFMSALGPLAAIVGSVAGGNQITNWITGSDNGLFSFPDIPAQVRKLWGMTFGGTLDPNTGQPWPDPSKSPLPPPITSAAPPPGYRRTKDDPNRYEPIPPGEPGYVDPNAPPPPPGLHVGAAIDPGLPAAPTGPTPWWNTAKLRKGTPDDPVHTKPPHEPSTHGGGGGGGTHPASADLPSTGDAKIDQWLLAQVPSGSYSQTGSADLTKGIGDCTSAIEDLIDMLEGKSTAGRTLNTGDADTVLRSLGFVPNYTGANIPGAFNVGFNSEHMQATLPGGTNFNWGSDAAAKARGLSGGGAFDPSQGFTEHWSKQFGSVPSGTPDDPVHTKSTEKDGKEAKDDNAETLGKSIVSGMLQELGLDGSVFGSDPSQWGIVKLFTGLFTDLNKIGGDYDFSKSTPETKADANSFLSNVARGMSIPDSVAAIKSSSGQPDGMDAANVVTALAIPSDGGPPGPLGAAPGPAIGTQDNSTTNITTNVLAPQPNFTPPASAGSRAGG